MTFVKWHPFCLGPNVLRRVIFRSHKPRSRQIPYEHYRVAPKFDRWLGSSDDRQRIGRAYLSKSWWRHQMETSSALLASCAGNSLAPVNSPHKGQWRGPLMFSLIWAWINGWVNNREAGNFRRYRVYYDVIVMYISCGLGILGDLVGRRLTASWIDIPRFLWDRLWRKHTPLRNFTSALIRLYTTIENPSYFFMTLSCTEAIQSFISHFNQYSLVDPSWGNIPSWVWHGVSHWFRKLQRRVWHHRHFGNWISWK